MPIDVSDIVTVSAELTKPLGGTLNDAWQALIGDRVAAWRLKNAMDLQLKIHEELKARGLAVTARIPDRFAVAWFEEATKQDEPEIQQLFARLLAGAASGDVDAGDRRHLEIVSRFVPLDAEVMRFFFTSDAAQRTNSREDGILNDIEFEEWEMYKAIREKLGDRAWQSAEHLLALGVTERRVTIDSDSVSAALMTLKSNHEGDVFPTWGSRPDIEIRPIIGSTATGLSLARALRLFDEGG
ncbi:MAG: hypothetical protein QM688_03715 [Sphingomonas bacterium]